MRPFMIPSLLLVVTGCTDESIPSTAEIAYTVEVVGRFEPVNPGNPKSRWIGVETIRITDDEGVLDCEDTLDADGPALPDGDALTLDMLRAELREVGESCDFDYTVEKSLTSGARYLSFVGHPGRFGELRGLVQTSEDFDTWDGYALGTFTDGVLIYHRTWDVYETAEPPGVGDDWEPKPLDELPIY